MYKQTPHVRSLEGLTVLVETLTNHVNQTALPCVVGMNNTMRLEKSNVIHIAALLNFDETITIGKKRKIKSKTIVKSFCPVHNTDTTLTSLFALHVPVCSERWVCIYDRTSRLEFMVEF